MTEENEALSEPLLADLNRLDPQQCEPLMCDGDSSSSKEMETAEFIRIEKPKSSMRWPVLVLACLMLIGSYYCFDIPSALKTQLNDYMQEPSKQYETDFALLYTLYAAPNVILPFFGGYFVDRFGVGLCLLTFTSLIAVGQVIVAIGFSIKSWPIIFLGRLIFALGGENLIVANSALLADWFKGKELAFAFGINLSIARVGSVVNNVLSPALTHSVGLIFSLWFGAIVCAGSVFCVVLTIPIDRKLDAQIAAQKSVESRLKPSSAERGSRLNSLGRPSLPVLTTATLPIALVRKVGANSTIMGIPVPAWLNPWASSAEERSPLTGLIINSQDSSGGDGRSIHCDEPVSPLYSSTLPGADSLHHRLVAGGTTSTSFIDSASTAEYEISDDEEKPGTTGSEASIQYKDVVNLPHIFWVLVAFCVVMYGSVLPFNNVASSLLLERNYFIEPNPSCQLQHPAHCQADPTNLPVNCTNQQFSYYQPPLPVNITLQGQQRCKGPNTSYGPQCIASDIDCTDSIWYVSQGSSSGCAQEYCERLMTAEKDAALVMSIPYTISGVVSPIVGLLIDKYGQRATIATVAAILVVGVHLSLGYSSISPVSPLVGQGLAYTGFAAVLWPAIPLVIQPRLTGLGFGIVTSALNAGCAVLPIIVAQVYIQSSSKYIPNVELLFAILGFAGLLLGIYLNYFDYHNGNILNRGEEPKGGWKSSGKGWRIREDGKYSLVEQSDKPAV